jgi:hypothetical protein
MLAPLSYKDPGDDDDVAVVDDDDVAAVDDNYRSEFRKKLCRDIVALAEKIMKEVGKTSWEWSKNYVGNPPFHCCSVY